MSNNTEAGLLSFRLSRVSVTDGAMLELADEYLRAQIILVRLIKLLKLFKGW